MFQREILIRKRSGAVYRNAARAVAVEEITTLDHEVFDLFPAAQSQRIHPSYLPGREKAVGWGKGRLPTTRWNLLPLYP